MDRVSVAIITFNEEANIKDCIKSCVGLASEIIVLDSFSTDKTLEIASTFPEVKTYQEKFKGHIEQKNRAIELCANEWIISLDADERLSEELKSSIERELENPPERVNGYKVSRLTKHMGKFIRHSGWYPLYRYRVFRKGKAKWTGENPHDYIEIEGEGKILKGDIIHFSFKDLTHQVETINKFSSIVSFTRFYKKNKNFSIIRSIIKPLIKFIEIYIYKLGFLDGYPGFVIAISSAYSTFLKDAKMYEYQKGIVERPSNLRSDYGK